MIQLLMMAKAPVPGRVKTRLCPPCTAEEAATIAAAALADTLETITNFPAVRRTLVLDGSYAPPPGWSCVPQRGAGLGERLAHAFADTALPGVPALLVGMDTPHLSGSLLHDAAATLGAGRAVLGPARDGGWWALGLHDPADAGVLPAVPMSTADTGALTLAALRGRGVDPVALPCLRDVDTAADAVAVAGECPPDSRFAAAVSFLGVGDGRVSFVGVGNGRASFVGVGNGRASYVGVGDGRRAAGSPGADRRFAEAARIGAGGVGGRGADVGAAPGRPA
ncbi:hypothetical protein Ade02nite_08600 [Paractinoplanes deccanensis]|uniref:Glycosyltransferase n=1 Tax=Paractinoplanes deccanensis TaxID=113561 RepID=A0ABQ3XWT7_9ACTN|nr:hypothetical protein Ade02nite_08600 [Actinoplanes deccanensis]